MPALFSCPRVNPGGPMPMDCPNGHGPMLRGRKHWLCEECGHRAALPADPAAAAPGRDLARLPHPLAVLLKDYDDETNAYVKLHRLCDAAELLTRFLAAVALADLVAAGRPPGPGQPLQAAVLEAIERPTFGG